MKEVGVDISFQKIKKLTKKMLENTEKVVVLSGKSTAPPYLINRKNAVYIKVDDPPDKDKTIDGLRKMRDEIRLIIDNLQ